jgi:hypothetical protein
MAVGFIWLKRPCALKLKVGFFWRIQQQTLWATYSNEEGPPNREAHHQPSDN